MIEMIKAIYCQDDQQNQFKKSWLIIKVIE